MSKDPKMQEALAHPDGLELLPGVKVTRRIALRGGLAAALLVALGESGCASEEDDQEGDQGEGSEKQKSEGSGGKEKSEQGKSSSKKSKESSEQSPEESKDPSQGPSADDDPSLEPSEEKEPSEEGEPEGEKSKEPEPDPEPEDTTPLSLQEIIDLAMDEAKALVKDKSIEEKDYQVRVSKLLARLDENERIPSLNTGPSHNIKRLKGEMPIQVFVLQMAPNAKIPLHDHGNRIGNLVGWRGTATTTNYTPLDKGSSGDSFLLQETSHTKVKPGATAHLSRVDNNFHVVEAGPQGATMIDFFTYYQKASGQPGEGSRWARLGEVVDKDKKIYRARYTSSPHLQPAHDFSEEVL